MASRRVDMTYQEPLSQMAIAISISESPDMAILGLGNEHLDDAMAEVARHLLALGARLLYGGDLRKDGFSNLLFELVTRHRRDADLGDSRVGVTNFLAWPVHIGLSIETLDELTDGLKGTAELVCLSQDGRPLTRQERSTLSSSQTDPAEWTASLSSMRRRMRDLSNARIVLGGRTQDYKGRMHGVAEEALLALQGRQPLYLLGGFGGCARDIASDLGLPGPLSGPTQNWPERESFSQFKVDDLKNGLTEEENKALAKTVHVDQAITLILRGLLRRGTP
jgi:hypothetical protein